MAWWTNPNVQIKQKNKFILSIGELMIPTVVSTDKPKIQVESKEYTMINHVYRYPGIAKWQPITVTFVDGAGGDKSNDFSNLDTAKMLERILKFSGYDSSSDFVPKGSTSKSGMSDVSFPLGSVRIEQISPSGEFVTEGWRLHNPIFTDISWGSLGYSDDTAVEYSLTIAYDWAEFYYNTRAATGAYTLNDMLASATNSNYFPKEIFEDELITPSTENEAPDSNNTPQ